MKILIGICGIGNGHCIRQNIIINELVHRGHEVRVLTYGNGLKFFQKSNILYYNVFVPMITFKNEKLNMVDFIKRNGKYILKGYFKNKNVFKKLSIDGFIPDVCISDYEPTVARFAYSHNIPLINIDQQSKFLYMNQDEINGYSISEEKKRMNLFFPKFNEKIIISFYKIDNNLLPSNVKLFSPFIRDEIKKYNKKNKKNTVIVYFSKFIDIPIKQDLNNICKIFSKFQNYKFVIYSSEHSNRNYENIIFKKNEKDSFAKDFGEACCAISTAGHTLISEAIFCNIPTFVIPLPTYDQNYCGKFINDNRIGISSELITYNNLNAFLNNINNYIQNINFCDNILKDENSLENIMKEIEKYEINN